MHILMSILPLYSILSLGMEEDCRIISSGVGYMLWVVIVSGCQVAKHVGGSLMEGTYHAYLVQADL